MDHAYNMLLDMHGVDSVHVERSKNFFAQAVNAVQDFKAITPTLLRIKEHSNANMPIGGCCLE